jgi:hypothetical protein
MAMEDNRYYIMRERNGKLECVASYESIEGAKQHAKLVVDLENKVCLILKPVVKISPNMDWIIQDLASEEENNV